MLKYRMAQKSALRVRGARKTGTRSGLLLSRQLRLDGNRQDRTGLTGGDSGSRFEEAQYEGELAQLVERCDRTAEVRGSNPLFSMFFIPLLGLNHLQVLVEVVQRVV